MDPLTLPLDYAAIEKILPHRYPSCSSTASPKFEVDKRIVGIKNISSNERYLTQSPDGPLVLPPTILTGDRPVGAILILAKPENRRLPFSRASSASVPPPRSSRRRRGDRSDRETPAQPDGVLAGTARVAGNLAVEVPMTFALGPAG
jgi:3-hydroxyacyl-[acyl-carrier-protein] dehydratase